MKKHGTFIISLDFELFWGIFDKADIKNKIDYFDNTLKTIPKILALFEQYQIRATWASVGFLFFKNIDELKKNLPTQLPQYQRQELSAYQYIKNRYHDRFNKYHFAPDMIKLIKNTPGQEIGSHTLSHYYCLEAGQNQETFKADLIKHIEIARQKNINLKSLVFPRNQFNAEYLNILKLSGIRVIRTNPNIWFWDTTKKETLLKKIFRTADAYFPIHQSIFNYPPPQKHLILLPASRFFRPANRFGFLNRLRLKRIKNEMMAAAKQHKTYHLWWHPHNFGNNPAQALKELKEILDHYVYLQKKFNFISKNMSDEN